MGDPKYPRRVWKKPKRPLNYELKMDELKTLGTFGLRTKRELWKAHTELSRVRHQARSLLALRQEVREEREPVLMKSLARIGLVSGDATLDDVLNLQVNDLLARRLQTIVLKKLGFKTPYQARQAVVHGHIMIGNRKVDIPSYTVTLEEEERVRFTPESRFPEMLEEERNRAKEPVAADPEAEEAAAMAEAVDAREAKTQTEEQAAKAEVAAKQAGAAMKPAIADEKRTSEGSATREPADAAGAATESAGAADAASAAEQVGAADEKTTSEPAVKETESESDTAGAASAAEQVGAADEKTTSEPAVKETESESDTADAAGAATESTGAADAASGSPESKDLPATAEADAEQQDKATA